MFRELRRIKQKLSLDECVKILVSCPTAVLSVHGEDGYPYGVPINYVYHQDKIYFHGAKSGHKIEAIRRNPKVSLTVIEQDRVDADTLSTHYRSVILFGTCRVLEEEKEVHDAARIFGLKYNPSEEAIEKEIQREWPALACFEIQVDHISGKQSKDFLSQD